MGFAFDLVEYEPLHVAKLWLILCLTEPLLKELLSAEVLLDAFNLPSSATVLAKHFLADLLYGRALVEPFMSTLEIKPFKFLSAILLADTSDELLVGNPFLAETSDELLVGNPFLAETSDELLVGIPFLAETSDELLVGNPFLAETSDELLVGNPFLAETSDELLVGNPFLAETLDGLLVGNPFLAEILVDKLLLGKSFPLATMLAGHRTLPGWIFV